MNPWSNAQEWTGGGKFPVGGAFGPGGPENGVLYRLGFHGEMTNYAVYDSQGIILYRVDLVGATHQGVPTPHLQTFTHNVGADGKVYAVQGKTAIPTGEGDIPQVGFC